MSALKNIVNKDLPDMANLEYAIWYTAGATTCGDMKQAAAELAALEAVAEAAKRIDLDGVANVLDELALDEGDETIVSDIHALAAALAELEKARG